MTLFLSSLRTKAVRFHDAHTMSSQSAFRDSFTSGNVCGPRCNDGKSVHLSGQIHHCEKKSRTFQCLSCEVNDGAVEFNVVEMEFVKFMERLERIEMEFFNFSRCSCFNFSSSSSRS